MMMPSRSKRALTRERSSRSTRQCCPTGQGTAIWSMTALDSKDTMLMTSGILMNIPADLYEAARVDGASTVKMFFKITLPYVIFVTTPYLISSFVGNINSFNTIFLLTGGGPVYTGYQAGGTDLLVTWLYKVTIDQGSYNTGAVIGIFTFIITATITLITYRRSKAYNEEDTFQ